MSWSSLQQSHSLLARGRVGAPLKRVPRLSPGTVTAGVAPPVLWEHREEKSFMFGKLAELVIKT